MTMPVELSAHARSRWTTRSDVPWVDLELAWYAGVELTVSGFDADEVRYHQRSETLLVRRDVTIVTVIDATDVCRDTRAAIDAVREKQPA